MSPFGYDAAIPKVAIPLAVAVLALAIVFLTLPTLLARLRRAREHRVLLELSDEKTALEIDDLRYGWMRTLGTALLTVVVAVGGWLVQRETDARGERQRDVFAQTDVFYKQLALLGSDGSTTRNSAVVYLLGWYTDTHPDDAVTQQFRHQVLYALITRYAVESDLGVSDLLGKGIFSIGTGAFTGLVDVNRQSAFQFAEDLGRVVAYEIASDELSTRERAFAEAATGDRSRLWRHVRPLATHALDRLNAEYSFVSRVGDGASDPHDNATRFKHFFAEPDQSLSDIFQRELRATLFLTFGKSASDRPGSDVQIRLISSDRVAASLRESQARLKQSAFVVRTTSNLIRKFLIHPEKRDCNTSQSLNRCQLDLRGTILVGLDLTNIDLRAVQLGHAVIYGKFDHVKLDFADLGHADLGGLTLKNSSLRYANIAHTFFPFARSDAQAILKARTTPKAGTARQTAAENYFVAHGARIAGADWWDVLLYGGTGDPVPLLTQPIAANDRGTRHDACTKAAHGLLLPQCPWR